MFVLGKNCRLVAALLLAVFLLTGCDETGDSKTRYLERGIAYYDEGYYDKAIVEFKNALTIDSKAAQPYFYIGDIAERKKDLRQASQNYAMVVKLDPGHIEANIRLGRFEVMQNDLDKASAHADEVLKNSAGNVDAIGLKAAVLYRQGKIDDAIKLLVDVLEQAPDNKYAALLLAMIYEEQNKASQSVTILERANEISADSEITVRLILLYQDRKETGKAEKALLELVRINPGEVQYWRALSDFYCNNDEVTKAEHALRNAIAEDPEHIQKHLLLVELYSSRFGHRKAIAETRKMIESNPDMTELNFTLARLYEVDGQLDKAEAVYQSIIDVDGLNTDGLTARTGIAKIEFQRGDMLAGKTLISDVLAEDPKNSRALLLKGKLAMREKDYAEAISSLDKLPHSVEVLTLLAAAYQENGDTARALGALSEAVEINPDDIKVRMRLASALMKSGKPSAAVKELDTILASKDKSVPALKLKAKILASTGNEIELEKALTQLVEASPDTAEGFLGRGALYRGQKKYAEALQAFEDAYTREPDSAVALPQLVEIQIEMGDSKDAERRLNSLISENPQHPAAHELLGAVYMSRSEHQRAEQSLSLQLEVGASGYTVYQRLAAARSLQGNEAGEIQAYLDGLDKFPDESHLLLGLANAYLRANKIDKAASTAEEGVITAPGNPNFQMVLASARQQQKRYDEAIAIYEKLLRIAPKNVAVINNLASLLADHRKDEQSLIKAGELVKSLANQKQPALMDTRGWVYYRLGNYEEAEEVLSDVVKHAPENAAFRYHLGMTYYQQGKLGAAREMLSGAISGNSTYHGVEEAKRVYEKLAAEAG